MTNPVRDNYERSRFEFEIDGQIVFASYQRTGSTLAILHVEAPLPLRGTGAAGRLMEGIMEIARATGAKIVPLCGYASAWLRRHREYAELLA
jgi:predicted GNAT family acetyltransferase